MRLASQISAESHQQRVIRLRSSRFATNDDAARPDLAILCREEAKELLASVTEEVLRLYEFLGLSKIL